MAAETSETSDIESIMSARGSSTAYLPHSHIPSFRQRNRRLNKKQQQLIQQYWHQYAISCCGDVLNLAKIYPNPAAPLVIEVGCGYGHFGLQQSQIHPENNYLFIETDTASVVSTLKQLVRHNLTNVRLIQNDAVLIFAHCLPPGSAREIHILFPDPWQKKRHHKRRLIRPYFLALIHRVLQPSARLFIATDWLDYAQHILTLCDKYPGLCSLASAEKYFPRPAWRCLTKYEQRGIQQGHTIYNFCYAFAATQ